MHSLTKRDHEIASNAAPCWSCGAIWNEETEPGKIRWRKPPVSSAPRDTGPVCCECTASCPFLNLTPHRVTIYDRNGLGPVLTLPSAGSARVREELSEGGGFLGGVVWKERAVYISDVLDLPEVISADTYPIVSLVTALTMLAAGDQRIADVWVPGAQLRDEKGRISGCKGLRMLAPRRDEIQGWE